MSLKFSDEPIVYVGAAITVLQGVQGYLQNAATLPLAINAGLVALGTIIGRQLVVPAKKQKDL